MNKSKKSNAARWAHLWTVGAVEGIDRARLCHHMASCPPLKIGKTGKVTRRDNGTVLGCVQKSGKRWKFQRRLRESIADYDRRVDAVNALWRTYHYLPGAM